jgi:hypothetical protein
MPYALLTCGECGAFYKHYAVGEVERWIRDKMNPLLRTDPAHYSRQVRKLESLCPYCRDALNGAAYKSTTAACVFCGRFAGRDKHRNCRNCGCPRGTLESRQYSEVKTKRSIPVHDASTGASPVQGEEKGNMYKNPLKIIENNSSPRENGENEKPPGGRGTPENDLF